MNTHPEFLGSMVLAGATLLGGLLVIMRLREHFAERPDPKLTYATQAQLQQLRKEVAAHQRDQKTDHVDTHRLIRQNAEHIAALIAQSKIYNQRITEFDAKFDHLHQRQR
ncbi:hypothetical protein [Cerasicoccus frondis]|uniref:hypothetical protein n=1 Tax=Cerasicoccus frondis TaxID=490090 RepID=UPI0028527283|nr:hypothetical protein [Cerasicoccus frondis]